MPKIVNPDSAIDWYTFRQLCEGAAADLVAAFPNDPAHGRIDLYREVHVKGRRFMVRVKLTLAPAGESRRRSTDELVHVILGD